MKGLKAAGLISLAVLTAAAAYWSLLLGVIQ